MKRILFCIVLAAVMYSGTALTSCKKTDDTKALITVIDTNGAAAPGVMVILWQDTAHNPVTGAQGIVRDTGITDGSGQAEFIYKNEAFLNIWAIRELDTAFGFIRMEQNKTTEATVHF